MPETTSPARRVTLTHVDGETEEVTLLPRTWFEDARCNAPDCACRGTSGERVSICCGACAERDFDSQKIPTFVEWWQLPAVLVLRCPFCDVALGAVRIGADA